MGQLNMERSNGSSTAPTDLAAEVRRLGQENLELRDKLKRARWAATIWQHMAAELAHKLDNPDEDLE